MGMDLIGMKWRNVGGSLTRAPSLPTAFTNGSKAAVISAWRLEESGRSETEAAMVSKQESRRKVDESCVR
jgi:hypothetical protein